MSQMIMLLIVGAVVVGGGAILYFNRCNKSVIDMGLGFMCENTKDTPLQGADISGKGIEGKDYKDSKGFIRSDPVKSGTLPATTLSKLKHCSKFPSGSGCKELFAQAKRNCDVNMGWLSGGHGRQDFCKGVKAGQKAKSGYVRQANLATESLMRMSY